jgi:hypothetical protein
MQLDLNQAAYNPIQLAAMAENDNPHVDVMIRNFFSLRTSIEIEEFYGNLSIHKFNKKWFEPAKVAMQLRRAEETADNMTAQMDRLIQHTEKLSIQTDKQIQNSLTLSNQTAILVTESKNLTKYTMGLLWLTVAVVGLSVVLAVLGILDYLDKHGAEPTMKNNSTNKL